MTQQPRWAQPPRAEIGWRDGVPFSTRFDDVYFSAQDGLAESRAVFLAGVGLPEAWRGRRRFAIGETGFGTGLNFLAAWDLWARDPGRPDRLDFVSVEGFPLAREEAARALSRWPELAGHADALASAWPEPHPGFHRMAFADGRVSLTLLLGPVEPMLAALEARLDAWFLDGFAPARNPEMWTEGVFSAVARLSRPGARLGTFTAAGRVRRGLEAAGFRCAKVPGHGRKREMIRAVFDGPAPEARGTRHTPWFAAAPARQPGRALVLGGGIAGACAARALSRRGWEVTLAERGSGLGGEASGNPGGIVMPRLVLGDGPERAFHAQAFQHAVRTYGSSPAYRRTGVLHLGGDPRLAEAGILPPGWIEAVDAAQAGALAGAALPEGGLWLPAAGWLDPREEIARLTIGTRVLLVTPVLRIERMAGGWLARGAGDTALAEAELVVLAGGPDLRLIEQAAWLPLVPRRGQVTLLRPPPGAAPRCVLGGGSYLVPLADGRLLVGATFDPVADAVPAPVQAPQDRDDRRNLAALAAMAPGLASGTEVLEARAGLRATTADHLPFAGPLPDREAWLADYAALRTGDRRRPAPPPTLHDGVMVLSGLGARGLTTAPLCAELVAAQVSGEPWPVPRQVAEALHPGRAIVRALRTRRA
ncbi:bifunctional tRNA (5-methylaminomethyl-2-thiouridine)(34)-methyltransferase MnmD/FAD-dependent 5-carboxymethylaminomethyl-2-thiouridine(34) oxidoreductase MnmC [Arenibaculum pallidiluteum]|uniref:bifunctional tRNA (5-methylaminomethyl-2-thiouridine)(34)-methyltransferase MnmD/FAD-dependent 5-carboxymethylaminomethyl-2-thiouridine(34) oxidoreductase MnmC n=1 Tax=Arenibaculum pallidiluteum TaxID=2812559 RepID=UPI001A96AA94|nr:bifunctional tRNA (5-methylaminomethyl-2-thiouridine)(34)-methyltransferase MnmD/FAD-dependent 5-carboxymethylaminomethyl-2-thiouridine(34) oxidoreductase MnmC [Arenibaculum pallidiluteum]